MLHKLGLKNVLNFLLFGLILLIILHPQQVKSKKYCRSEWQRRLPEEIYVLDTCARCYNYMPETAFKANAKFRYFPFGLLINPETNVTVTTNETFILSRTFTSASLIIKWQQCCMDAMHCCLDSLQYYEEDEQSVTCPPTWDGWTCWSQAAKPDQVLQQSCPKHIYWNQIVPPCRGYATKKCNSSGEWFLLHGKEWSNYSTCARYDVCNALKVSGGAVKPLLKLTVFLGSLMTLNFIVDLAVLIF